MNSAKLVTRQAGRGAKLIKHITLSAHTHCRAVALLAFHANQLALGAP